MADWETALAAAEDDAAAEVAAVLDEVADEFAAALEAATEIVAARFSVSRIATMWGRHVPRLVRRFLGIVEDAASKAADSVGEELPDGWDDLPGRYDDDTLPKSLGDYVDSTEHLLRAVGDDLSDRAVKALAAGLDAGEDVDALRARLRASFAREEGAQLGPGRQERIARTEASRAWNSSTLAAAQDLSGPDRPLVKQWRTRGDSRVRHSHDRVDGQLRLLDEPFRVGGHDMMHPGDPTAPADETVNCRCVLRLERARGRTSSLAFVDVGLTASFETKATGRALTAAADDQATEHTGAMIALVPSDEDARRLALDGGEPVDELHLTLWYLGEAVPWSEDQRNELIGLVRSRAAALSGPIVGRAFGVNHWNPGSDDPAWVWAISDDRDTGGPRLEDAHRLVVDALESTHDRPDTPAQHSPWVPHVTGTYTPETWPLEAMIDRLGPITFDRVRLAFAGDTTDIPLGPEEEPPMEPTAAAETAAEPFAPPVRAWSTPGDTALAFEGQETGDGRIFASGALYWDGSGPWPLQYADEMLMGHEGAVLAGSIASLDRQDYRIPGSGVLYLAQRAGAEAAMLLEQGAPLGVSVDLDDVDVEFVARNVEEDDGLVLAASLPAVNVLPMADGSWCLTASHTSGLTASTTSDDSDVFTRHRHTAQVITTRAGALSADAVRELVAAGTVTAAAGDTDNPEDGIVVHAERSGDWLVRITRARVRGATLVTVPAFADARIVLDDPEDEGDATAAAVSAAAEKTVHDDVIHYVRVSPAPVGAPEVARALDISVEQARGHLGRAVQAGTLIRLGPGQYAVPSTLPEGVEVEASAAEVDGLVASAWTAMQDLPPMPADWFREPTEEELPPGSGGVHFSKGRIYGWVAQAGVPHAGYPGKNLTIEKLAKQGLDFSHFLRAKFPLDDGTMVKAGAFTMNAPHHRDGAECESAVCQFDDSRTVAGIVTVGYNSRGLWFAGACAPWLSDWDRRVFLGCQPSYHLNQGRGGKWELRAVLTVPVPGHSSPLLTAAIERANMALCASAALADAPSAPTDATPSAPVDASSAPGDGAHVHQAGHPSASASAPLPSGEDGLVEVLAAVLTRPDVIDTLAAAVTRRQDEEAQHRAEIEALTAELETTDLVTAAAAAAGTDPKGQS
ncbi:phage minor head protein [Streptomyces antimycoticus]|uniref:phage minor head protein n=1 Tax=Streptomyces antimycoticus TaxID=68175 RepID=UPI0036BB7F26